MSTLDAPKGMINLQAIKWLPEKALLSGEILFYFIVLCVCVCVCLFFFVCEGILKEGSLDAGGSGSGAK